MYFRRCVGPRKPEPLPPLPASEALVEDSRARYRLCTMDSSVTSAREAESTRGMLGVFDPVAPEVGPGALRSDPGAPGGDPEALRVDPSRAGPVYLA